MLRIDAFTHIWPRAYADALIAALGETKAITRRVASVPMMTDLDVRFRVMDEFGPEYRQILSLAAPPLEAVGDAETALGLARIGSDSLAELCARYPDRFAGFVATVPIASPDAGVEESRRALDELGALGTHIFTNVGGRPLDRPEFEPFFAFMAGRGRPVWMHPARTQDAPDYLTEHRSEYEIWWALGWPYETSAAMARMVFSGLLDRHPGLTIITHHAGGLVPFLEGRIGPGWDQMGSRTTDRDLGAARRALKRHHLDYFRGFVADTATFGSRKAIEHAIEFFGEDRVVFASDAPFDPEGGPMYIRETMRILDALEIDETLRRKLYQDNIAAVTGLAL